MTISPEIVRTLSDYDQVIGIKDSTGNLGNISETFRLLGEKIKEFKILAGSTHTFFPIMELGGVGANIYIANIVPEICVELYNSFQAGNHKRARDLQLKLLTIDKVLAGKWGAAAVKEAMRLRGIPAGYPRRPLLTLEKKATIEIGETLKKHGLLE
jgi:4-hydroxy-tetrahydrodipicolinate synthase